MPDKGGPNKSWKGSEVKLHMAILVALTAIAISAVPASGQSPSSASTADATVPTPAFGMQTFRLWPGRAPEATSDSASDTPTVTLFRPHPGAENGTAVIVAPGGGYLTLASVLEGREVADWFTSRGVTAFVLTYRVGPKARLPIPLLDGTRAVRYVRANAARFKINPDRIGMIGFSAGGHLTATTAANADAGARQSADPVERASSKVNFAILGYPWLEATTPRADGRSQYCLFQMKDCDSSKYVRYSPISQVKPDFPPTFLYHTTADSLVSASGVVKFYEALVANKVSAEMHIFAKGPHGTGLGGSASALTHWPELLEEWLRAQGLFMKTPKA